MKTIPGLVRLTALLFFVYACVHAAPVPDHDVSGAPRSVKNLLANGDFEISTQFPEWPDHWGRPQEGLAEWKAREDNAHYVVLKATAPGQNVLMYRAMMIPEGLEAVDVSVRARVTGLKRGLQMWHDARVMIELKNVQSIMMKPSPKPIVFGRDTPDWVTKTVTVQIPSGAKILEIMPCLFQVAEGTFELDYVLVAPASTAPVR